MNERTVEKSIAAVYAGVRELVKQLDREGKAPEFFTLEAPSNNYTPAPPKGYFALRSSRRRIFMPGRRDDLAALQTNLQQGNFQIVEVFKR